ncbi:MAG: DNA-binding domain-containing protein [Roseobacter sp.]|jgi:hypothetical protein
MKSLQTRFRTALLDTGLPVPEGLQDQKGNPAGARFSVYRNNVVVSLTEALATAFPLVRKLLGSRTFTQLAGLYVRAHPPTTPMMMFYGAAFPDFLDGFEPLKHLGYLPDCSRLDLALRQSYHAADAKPLDQSILSKSETGGMDLRLALAPSAKVLRSAWPLYDIWRFNTQTDAPKPRAVSQDVLVARPEFDPVPLLLPVGAADLLERLDQGTPLGAAAEQTLTQYPSFDLLETLTLTLSTTALVETGEKEI